MASSNNTTPKSSSPLFIHSDVDDYGFPVTEFRLIGRIARRGKCFEAVDSIAQGCRLKPRTVRKALQRLVALNVLRPNYRKGESTEYEINPIELWNPSPFGTGVTTALLGQGGSDPKRPGSGALRGQGHPSPLGTGKVTPSEVNSPKGSPTKGESSPPRIYPSEAQGGIRECREALKAIKNKLDFETDPEKRGEWIEKRKTIKAKMAEYQSIVLGVSVDAPPANTNPRNIGLTNNEDEQSDQTAQAVKAMRTQYDKIDAERAAKRAREYPEPDLKPKILNTKPSPKIVGKCGWCNEGDGAINPSVSMDSPICEPCQAKHF